MKLTKVQTTSLLLHVRHNMQISPLFRVTHSFPIRHKNTSPGPSLGRLRQPWMNLVVSFEPHVPLLPPPTLQLRTGDAHRCRNGNYGLVRLKSVLRLLFG